LVGTHNQANVSHQQHDQDLEETLGVALGNAAANHQREEVRAADSEDTSDRRPDQSLEADGAQFPFEQNDGCADQCADTRIFDRGQSERIDCKASSRYNEYKKKTYKDKIHGKPPRGCSFPVTNGSCTRASSRRPSG